MAFKRLTETLLDFISRLKLKLGLIDRLFDFLQSLLVSFSSELYFLERFISLMQLLPQTTLTFMHFLLSGVNKFILNAYFVESDTELSILCQ